MQATQTDIPSFVDRAGQRVQPAGLSDDPLSHQQWHLDAPPTEIAGTGLRDALDTPRQLESVVVALVDTGVLPSHTDMGELLPGYDFVSDVLAANDGDGRDDDPSDPGDWITQAEIEDGTFNADCAVGNSSWHGTAVAGILAANTDNMLGIAGAAPMVKILPVRVMGRCGGTVTDLIAGVRWAAGLAVANVPLNPNPASVINLSLGYHGRCSSAMQSAIRDARAAGATVVTAIGNGGISLASEPYSPASCAGVISVAAATRGGNFAQYNNRGAAIDILAPGGVPGAGLTTLDDGGTRSARNDSLFQARYGSSIATPLVSATAAMMLAANPLLEPHQIEGLLVEYARAVSDESQCIEHSCGGGLLDARLAVHAAATTDVRELRIDDELLSSGGGGALHPVLLLLLLLHQRGVHKIAQLVQHCRGELPRRQRKTEL
ncbi:MAG: S8 family peptidase [Granulosicoccaceae bacterium]